MENFIFDKINSLKNEFDELNAELSAGFSTVDKLKKYTKISDILELVKNYEKTVAEFSETKELANTDDIALRELCLEECEKLRKTITDLDYQITDALVEKDPDDICNAIFELSGEVGGEEANLFARDLYEMYIRYATSKNYSVDLIDLNETPLGGINSATFRIVGGGAYGTFKYESGVHRVQRVPNTEAKGRIHTSTASVMVTPEIATDKFDLNLDDVEITTCHASGAGGQHINKTSSAIRAIYKPTGLTVFCQSRRSQLQNKEEALRIIASRIKADKEASEQAASSANKAAKLGTRNRSEKIRTYNFPENRFVDHRINFKNNSLDKVLQGDLDEIIKALHIADYNN